MVAKMQKHPLFILMSIVVLLIAIVRGPIQITQDAYWVYEGFLKENYTEKNIFDKITPGNNYEYIKSYLGEPQKTSNNGNQKILIWKLKNIILGMTINEESSSVDTIILYSPECKQSIRVPQLGFELCKNRFPEYKNSSQITWDSFLGAQNAAYVEQHPSWRGTRYLENYYGTARAVSFLWFIKDNSNYFDNLSPRTLKLEAPMDKQIQKFRENIIPNFVAMSKQTITPEEMLGYFSTLMNFDYL